MSDTRDPRSASDREYASWHTTGDKRRTARYVVGPDGAPIGEAIADGQDEMLLELRAIRRGLEILTDTELLTDD